MSGSACYNKITANEKGDILNIKEELKFNIPCLSIDFLMLEVRLKTLDHIWMMMHIFHKIKFYFWFHTGYYETRIFFFA